VKSALTVGAIARELNEPIHRVQYAIRTRGIEPELIAGNLRIFPPEAVEQIAEILRDINSQQDRDCAARRQPAARGQAVRWNRAVLERWIADGCPSVDRGGQS
jgi:hypothetical protein